MQLRPLASFFSSSLLMRSSGGSLRIAHLSVVLAFVLLTAACVASPEPDDEPELGPPPKTIAPPVGATGANPGEDARIGREFLQNTDAESLTYDSSLPAASTAADDEDGDLALKASTTDSEVIDFEGGAGSVHDQELGEIERDLGLEPEVEPFRKRPSLSLGLRKVKTLYKKRKFDVALIEANTLLEFYPRSPQLLMMKGTLHQWLGQMDLALASYEQAQFYRPTPKLAAQIKYLRLKVREREKLRGTKRGDVIPGGIDRMEVDVLGFEDMGPSGEEGGNL